MLCYAYLFMPDCSNADCSGKKAMGLYGVANMSSGKPDDLVTSVDVTDSVYAHHFSCFMRSERVQQFLHDLWKQIKAL